MNYDSFNAVALGSRGLDDRLRFNAFVAMGCAMGGRIVADDPILFARARDVARGKKQQKIFERYDDSRKGAALERVKLFDGLFARIKRLRARNAHGKLTEVNVKVYDGDTPSWWVHITTSPAIEFSTPMNVAMTHDESPYRAKSDIIYEPRLRWDPETNTLVVEDAPHRGPRVAVERISCLSMRTRLKHLEAPLRVALHKQRWNVIAGLLELYKINASSDYTLESELTSSMKEIFEFVTNRIATDHEFRQAYTLASHLGQVPAFLMAQLWNTPSDSSERKD